MMRTMKYQKFFVQNLSTSGIFLRQNLGYLQTLNATFRNTSVTASRALRVRQQQTILASKTGISEP